jgi:hypothetical protein
MKITIVTNENGLVVGTYRHGEERPGQPKLRLHAGPKQSLHEIELPRELEETTSVDELHSRLGEHLKKGSK